MAELADRIIAAFAAGRHILDSQAEQARRAEALQLQREEQQAQLADAASRLELLKSAAEFTQGLQTQQLAAGSADPRKSTGTAQPVAGGVDLGEVAPSPRPSVQVGGMSFPLQFMEDIEASKVREGEAGAGIAGQKRRAEAQAEEDVKSTRPITPEIQSVAKAIGFPLSPGATAYDPAALSAALQVYQEKQATTRAGIAASSRNRPSQILMDDRGYATQIIDKATGETIADLTGRGLKIRQDPVERQKTQRELSTSLSRIKDIGDMFKPEYVGPAAGRLYALQEKIPGLPVDEKRSEFVAANTALKNEVIKFITGAQMSEPEAQRILQQVPDVVNKPGVWRARYVRTVKNLEFLQQVIDGTITKEDALARIDKTSFDVAQGQAKGKEQTRVMRGHTYRKVPGGWQRVD